MARLSVAELNNPPPPSYTHSLTRVMQSIHLNVNFGSSSSKQQRPPPTQEPIAYFKAKSIEGDFIVYLTMITVGAVAAYNNRLPSIGFCFHVEKTLLSCLGERSMAFNAPSVTQPPENESECEKRSKKKSNNCSFSFPFDFLNVSFVFNYKMACFLFQTLVSISQTMLELLIVDFRNSIHWNCAGRRRGRSLTKVIWAGK